MNAKIVAGMAGAVAVAGIAFLALRSEPERAASYAASPEVTVYRSPT